MRDWLGIEMLYQFVGKEQVHKLRASLKCIVVLINNIIDNHNSVDVYVSQSRSILKIACFLVN